MDRCQLVVMRQDGIGEVEDGSGGAVSLCPLMGLIPSGSCIEIKEREGQKKKKKEKEGFWGGGM